MMHTLRALPTMLRVGFAEAVAYRAEMLVWVLSTTMPLVMMPLWQAVADEVPIGGFTHDGITAYFLATFVVRQLTSAWASWTMNYEVRTGALSMRLLKPIHPLWAYAVENLSAIPMRLAVALPVSGVALWLTGGDHTLRDPALIPVLFAALAGAWSITFLAHIAVGCLSLWVQQSIKVMDAWTAGFFVFSGYLIPIRMFPAWLRPVPEWLPFRYQLGYPVMLLTEPETTRSEALRLLAAQWTWVALLGALCVLLWTRGIRRYQAYGG